MSCANIKSFTYNACQGNVGGIKKVWIANYVDGAVTPVDDASASAASETLITGFTTGYTSVSGTNLFYEFNFRKNTASMTSTLNVSDNGSSYVSTELSMVFSRMDADKRAAIMALVLSDAMVIVEDCNGNKWFLGEMNPVNASASTGESGTQKSDNNAYSITLTDDNNAFPRQLSDSFDFSSFVYTAA